MPVVPPQMAGGMAQSSSSSGIFFQGDGQSQVGRNNQSSPNFRNSLNPIPGNTHGNTDPLSGDVSNAVLNSVASSGPSIGASSLVTDANSGLSGCPHLQRSASFNTDSYMRLPASPMSFTSNNISVSGSSVMDGSSIAQKSSNQDPSSQAHQNLGASSATSMPTSRMGQCPPFPGGPRGPNAFSHDPTSITHLQKKPRLDIKQEDIFQQQVLQQLLQRQDSMHLQNPNPQLQAIVQQQRLRHQQQREQQLLQSMSPLQRMQFLQQQQQQQLRQQLLQQGLQPAAGIKRPYDVGVCSRRLMQYLYHQRQLPSDNPIAYWRKFVVEYYSPRAKKRWCLSLYGNVGNHTLGVFPQAAMDAWQCDICGSKSGRGFEATYEVLPRLNEIKFGSGVIDELLFLDFPREIRFPSGMMMLEFSKAVQETVYDPVRVVREGHLRIIFTPDLKILSWEFCARHHEELLPRRLVAPQVNQLLQVAQKCQSTISDRRSDGISQPDLQANSVMVVTAGRQLARSLELQSLNDLGFSKRYVRCLQIAEVVNSMKDLMDSCKEQKVGPIEGLKNFPRHASMTKVQIQEMEQVGSPWGLPTDPDMLNKLTTFHPGLNSPRSNSQQHMVGRGAALAGSPQAALAMSNYQNLLMRQNSMNSTQSNSSLHQEAPFNASRQTPPNPVPSGAMPRNIQNSPVTGGQTLQHQQSPSGNAAQQQQIIQQLPQHVRNKSNGAAVPQANQGLNSAAAVASVGGQTQSNSFKAASSDESPAPAGFGQKGSDLAQNFRLLDELMSEFNEDGFFDTDLDENMGFSWKA